MEDATPTSGDSPASSSSPSSISFRQKPRLRAFKGRLLTFNLENGSKNSISACLSDALSDRGVEQDVDCSAEVESDVATPTKKNCALMTEGNANSTSSIENVADAVPGLEVSQTSTSNANSTAENSDSNYAADVPSTSAPSKASKLKTFVTPLRKVLKRKASNSPISSPSLPTRNKAARKSSIRNFSLPGEAKLFEHNAVCPRSSPPVICDEDGSDVDSRLDGELEDDVVTPPKQTNKAMTLRSDVLEEQSVSEDTVITPTASFDFQFDEHLSEDADDNAVTDFHSNDDSVKQQSSTKTSSLCSVSSSDPSVIIFNHEASDLAINAYRALDILDNYTSLSTTNPFADALRMLHNSIGQATHEPSQVTASGLYSAISDAQELLRLLLTVQEPVLVSLEKMADQMLQVGLYARNEERAVVVAAKEKVALLKDSIEALDAVKEEINDLI